jgi:predicted RND superfamily exporter protein
MQSHAGTTSQTALMPDTDPSIPADHNSTPSPSPSHDSTSTSTSTSTSVSGLPWWCLQDSRLGWWSSLAREKFQHVFYHIGSSIGKRPWVGIILGLLITIAAGSGMANFEVGADNSFWVPRDLESYQQQHRIAAYFGSVGASDKPTDTQLVISSSGPGPGPGSGQNVLDMSILTRAFELEQEIRTTPTLNGIRFDDVCDRRSIRANCTAYSIFEFLQIYSVSQLHETNVYAAIDYLPPGFVGGIKRASNGSIISATALYSSFIGTTDPTLSSKLDEWEEVVIYGVIQPFIDNVREQQAAMNAMGTNTKSFHVAYTNEFGKSVEVKALVAGEYPLFGGTIMLILIYMCGILGGKPFRHSRLLLGATCIFTVLCSLVIALGVTTYLSVPTTVLAPLVIFVLLGIGVDDIIIITSAFEHAVAEHPLLPLHQQVGEALRDAGYAISITSLTSFVAFIFASFVDFPAISYFCYTGACGVVAVFVLQLTFFAGCLTYDERRVRSSRYDVCFCFKYHTHKHQQQEEEEEYEHEYEYEHEHQHEHQQEHEQEHKHTSSSVPNADIEKQQQEQKQHDKDHHTTTTTMTLSAEELVQSHTHKSMIRNALLWCADKLSHRQVQIGVVIVFMTFTAWSAYSTTTLTTDSDVTTFFPKDSFVYQFFDAIRTYFSTNKRPVFIVTEHANFNLQSTRDALLHMQTQLQLPQPQPIIYPPIQSWLSDFNAYVNVTSTTVTPNTFVPILQTFLASAPFMYNGQLIDPSYSQRDVAISNGQVIATRIKAQVSWRTGVSEVIEDKDRLRAAINSVTSGSGNSNGNGNDNDMGFSYPWNINIVWSDRDEQMPESIVRNLSLAAIGVTGSLLLLIHPSLVLLIGGCIVLIDIDVMGVMALWGQPLDVSSFVVLAMAIGLSVDYVVHIAFHLMLQSQHLSRTEKLRRTFSHMGSSVFNGGLSTFLGVCLLVFAKSPGFRTFFRILFCTVLFGLLHGLIFAPAVLALIDNSPRTKQDRLATDSAGKTSNTHRKEETQVSLELGQLSHHE